MAGRTILEWTWRRALDAVGVSSIWIATDSDEIADEAEQFGSQVIRTGLQPTGSDRVAAALDSITPTPRWVINLQGDEPLLDPSVIIQLYRKLITSSDRIITCATPLRTAAEWLDPARVKVVCDSGGRALYFSRAPIPATQGGTDAGHFEAARSLCLGHIGLYGYPVAILKKLMTLKPSPLEKIESLEQLRALEAGIEIDVVKVAQRSLAVDTPADLEKVRQILEDKKVERSSTRAR